MLGVVLGLCITRQGLGVLFTRSTGWALPSLFFNDALHECSQVQSISVDDKYILIYGNENSFVTIRKVTLQIFMCLVNCTSKNILWWSLTGLLVGYIATMIVQIQLAEQEDANDYHRRKPMWRLIWPAMKKGAAVILVTLPVLLIYNAYYSRDTFDSLSLNAVSDDRYLFTFVIMTAPRRSDPPFLTQTLKSYLDNWPSSAAEGPLYNRMQTVVYTHFSNHTQYDLAQEHFSADPRGQHYIRWIRDSGGIVDQRLHVSKALRLAADTYDSTYIALLEDDFPVCGPREWHELERVVYEANQRVPDHCGLFVATGGRFSPIHTAAECIDNLSRQQAFETEFCRDFECCGRQLLDMHDLLQHFEEHHVYSEDEDQLLVLFRQEFPDTPPLATHITNRDLTALENSKQLSQLVTGNVDEEDGSVRNKKRKKTLAEWSPQDWLAHANALLNITIEHDTSNKPYKCCVLGCDKAYKNANGLKYHRLHGHCFENETDGLDRKPRKPYTCSVGSCRKRYKNLNGLKYHIEHAHMAKLQECLTASVLTDLLS
ncbi:Transcriptional regulator of ribosomal bioproteinsis proteins [Apophysomyces ossiformis]|uniref:Transcriptional regulator of ribosomal bioproteinsis proteins n=1 Tax=Apophysomyces ossiformis TaxID=679940 RepID=A0A8H7BVP5_9FUNG|nr:Transcriptional regulator of ribosomal bioproteinsis proteins [Apophysomyces ossiformis]